MSGFTYDAGSATPLDQAGLVEWTDARFSSDGSFRSLILPPLWTSAPLVVARAAVPGDGAFIPDPELDGWDFDIKGWLLADEAAGDDVQSAFDYLRSKVNVGLGWQTVLFNSLAWDEPRQMRLRVTGQITADPPDKGDLMSPERDITIPVSAADPRLYTTTPSTVALNGDLVNEGNYDTPLTVVFTGPLTNPQIDGPGAAGTNRIRLAMTIASGHSVTVTTYDPDTAALTAIDDLGVNVYDKVANATGRVVKPGTESWTFTKDSGSGTCDATIRSAWA